MASPPIVLFWEPSTPGVDHDLRLARVYAAVRAARLYDGPDEVPQLVVSRRILKVLEAGGVWDFAGGGPAA
jgi:hypothetical protein